MNQRGSLMSSEQRAAQWSAANAQQMPQQQSLLPGDPKGVVTKTTTDKIQSQITGNINNLSLLLGSVQIVEKNLGPLLQFDPKGGALTEIRKYKIKEAIATLKPQAAFSPVVFVWVCQYIPKGTPMAVVYDMVDFAFAQLKSRHPRMFQ
jgi:hypothetical protein